MNTLSSSDKGIKSFRDLIAWRQSMAFVVAVYQETSRWPTEERYGLSQQLRRSSVSIPSNIAEGQGRRSDRDFANFLRVAHGSLQEAETQIMIGRQLGYCSIEAEQKLLNQSSEIGRLIQGLRRSLRSDERLE